MKTNEEMIMGFQKYLNMAEISYDLTEDGPNKKVTIAKGRENSSIFATEIDVKDSMLQIRKSCVITCQKEREIAISYEKVESTCTYDSTQDSYHWLENYDTINAVFSKENKNQLLLMKRCDIYQKDEAGIGEVTETSKEIKYIDISATGLKESVKVIIK